MHVPCACTRTFMLPPHVYMCTRAEIIQKREKYEAKNSGGFVRIFPSDDADRQAVYEELLRASAEIHASAFGGSRAGRRGPMGADWEERRRKEAEDSEAAKAERARAKVCSAP